MENHPIPQDVTGFQFKLIGNMTVKQFAYLATGIILGWVFLQLPISIFIKLPFSIFFAVFGVGLAFFPISGRPMDAMIGNFIKALLRPTQFFYEKTGTQLYYPSAKVSFNGTLPFQQKDKLKDYLASQTNNPSLQPQPGISKPTAQVFVQPLPDVKTQPQPLVLRSVSSGFNRTIGLPSVPESPNLITGVTRDARGNPLASVLVEIKDKEGNPVRAFKTNEVGRFASATPLINGTYTIEFEDSKGQNKFEKGIINVTGQIIQPVVAMSIDAREELRRSLFNAN